MKNIFLAPRSNETAYKNYMSSMSGKSLDDFSEYLSEEDRRELSGDEKYFVWGCQPSLENRWKKMRHGDYIMFYSKGKFISYGQLKFKKKSEALALSLWPRSKGSDEPWSCVFFVENIQDINLPIGEFAEITGYKFDRVQGFMSIENRLPMIIDKYGSTDNFMASLTTNLSDEEKQELVILAEHATNSLTSEDKARIDALTREKSDEELQSALTEYAQNALHKAPQQVERLVKSFKRNRSLVTDIKAKYHNKCQICGFTFKTASGKYYSEAAHIIAISTGIKGVDSPDNIWVLCANHHKMLDLGAIKSKSKSQYIEDGQAKDLMYM